MTDYGSMRPRRIGTNPGGVIDPADLVGRERELARLLRAIERGGAKVLGERRMGKTSLLHAAEHVLDDRGDVVVRVSAETDDPSVFAAHLRDAMAKPRRLRDALAKLGAEINVNVGPFGLRVTGGGAPADGFDFFRHCAQLVRETGDCKLVFVFDEITTLARALERRQEGGATAFFHSLRVPRQELTGVAVVVAGSVGLHHVLDDMSPVNDISPVEVGPLQPDAAKYLARCLLVGAGLTDDEALASEIARQASNVPFYIHKIIEEIELAGEVPAVDGLDALVDEALRSNRWDTEHSLTRIEENFGDDAEAVLAMLDHYAVSDHEVLPDELLSALQGVELDYRPNRSRLLRLIGRLEDDHYLTRTGDADSFATPLLRRTWRIMRRPK